MFVYIRTTPKKFKCKKEIEEQIIKDLLDGYMFKEEYYTVKVNDLDKSLIDLRLKYPFNKFEVITMTVKEFKVNDKYEKIINDAIKKYVK